MLQVVLLMYSIIAMTFAGTGVLVVLVVGVTQLLPIIGAAAAGAITALPVSYFVARKVVV